MVAEKGKFVLNHNINSATPYMKSDHVNTVRNICRNLTEQDRKYTYEEAIDLTGTGRYNRDLMITLSVMLLSMGLDIFGFSVIVTGCSCEFPLTQTQKGILNSMPFIGPVIMSCLWGYISDTQGRRRSLLIAMTLSFIFSVLGTFSPNWILLAALKLISTSFCNCAQSATFVLLGESCGEKCKGSYMLYMSTSIIACPAFHYFLAYLVLKLDFSYDLGILGLQYTPWRLLALIMTLPLALGSLLLVFFYESPKFLMNAGREGEALDTLRMIWVRNGGHPDKYPVKKLILSDNNMRRTDTSFLKSLVQQTLPLFKPPLLVKTLHLFYITAVIYGSSNSFVIWLPFVANAFFDSLKRARSGNNGFCTLLNMKNTDSHHDSRTTSAECRLDDYTAFAGIALGLSFGLMTLLIAYLASRRKMMTIAALLLSSLSALGVVLSREPVSAVVLYVCCTLSALGTGLVSTYYVDLFPTSHRGMAACFGVIVGRVCALGGINLVGAFIHTHCTTTFIVGSIYVLSGVIAACFLPSDQTFNKL